MRIISSFFNSIAVVVRLVLLVRAVSLVPTMVLQTQDVIEEDLRVKRKDTICADERQRC